MKKMIIEIKIDENDFAPIMKSDNLTLEEAIHQEIEDGNLDFNELVFCDIKIQDIEEHSEIQNNIL
jgi:hypothetical protein